MIDYGELQVINVVGEETHQSDGFIFLEVGKPWETEHVEKLLITSFIIQWKKSPVAVSPYKQIIGNTNFPYKIKYFNNKT